MRKKQPVLKGGKKTDSEREREREREREKRILYSEPYPRTAGFW